MKPCAYNSTVGTFVALKSGTARLPQPSGDPRRAKWPADGSLDVRLREFYATLPCGRFWPDRDGWLVRLISTLTGPRVFPIRSPNGQGADIQLDTSRTDLPHERRRITIAAVALRLRPPVAVALDGPHAAYCRVSAAARARRSLATDTKFETGAGLLSWCRTRICGARNAP